MAREVGCSPTTVGAVFTSPRLPSWGLLELVVEALGGEVETFRELWRAAGEPTSGARAADELAGRRREVGVVRRHLAEGTGRLLLVSGEAGIGKTRLLDAAGSGAEEVWVARGRCLPLSTEVPFLPLAEVLRAVHDRDHGATLARALARCASYVPGALVPLIPEVADLAGPAPVVEAHWERYRLLSALRATLTALSDDERLAVVIEDLHWADGSTQDALDFLAGAEEGRGIPLVASYRSGDPSTAADVDRWLVRMVDHPRVDHLPLGPLAPAETAEQLRLLGYDPTPDVVDALHRRSGGHPLFTEQLAAEGLQDGIVDQRLPQGLAELLDQRLTGLRTGSWQVIRALGIADRDLSPDVLEHVTGLSDRSLAEAFHELGGRRLLATTDDRGVRIRHPLLAEAIRGRLVPGEVRAEHRSLAIALAASSTVSPAEVAEHWRRAQLAEKELEWRIRAARAAEERFALAQAAFQWRQALALWPHDADSHVLGTTRSAAYVATMDALMTIDVAQARAVAQDAILTMTDPSGPEAAETYQLAAEAEGTLGDPEGALGLLDKALRIYEGLPPSRGHAQALARRELFETALGREADAAASAAAAAEAARAAGDPAQYRFTRLLQVQHDAVAGDVPAALARLHEALGIEVDKPDPKGEIFLVGVQILMLRLTGRDAREVADVGRRGLEVAQDWELDTFPVSALRCVVSSALRHEGYVGEAAAVIDQVSEGAPSLDRLPVHCERALLDMLRGRPDEALARVAALDGFPVVMAENHIEATEDAAMVELWCDRPAAALQRLLRVIGEHVHSDASAYLAGLLALAARAAAEVGDRGPGATRADLLEELRQAAATDPFVPHPAFPDRPALRAAWAAEEARLTGNETVEGWVAAATAWQRLRRRHEAAYCRWRGAQVADRDGAAPLAARLLRAAARDAVGHAPLQAAIDRPVSDRQAAHPARTR